MARCFALLGCIMLVPGTIAGCSSRTYQAQPAVVATPTASPSGHDSSLEAPTAEEKSGSAPDLVKDDATPPICREQQRIQETLAELALRTMEDLGRVDPHVYKKAEPGAKLTLPNELDGSASAELRRAVEAVNADKLTLKAFAVNQAAALAACGEDCPPRKYKISVTTEELKGKSDGRIERWTVKDEAPPSAIAWRDGFLRQYTFAQPECYPLMPLLELIDPDDELFAKGRGAGGIRSGLASMGDGGNCKKNKTNCGDCEMYEDGPDGVWHKEGKKYCCREYC